MNRQTSKLSDAWGRASGLPFVRALGVGIGAMVVSGVALAQNTTFTNSTSRTESFVDTQQAVREDTFSTRLLGVLDGSTTVYDQTFNTAFSDPLVQAAIASAQGALAAVAAPQAVTISGPTLTSSTTTQVGSNTGTAVTSTETAAVLAVEVTIGPGTALIGDLGLCAGLDSNNLPFGCTGGSPQTFTVLTGNTNFNVNGNTQSTIFRTITTTTTFLTSAVYTLFGTTQGGGGGSGGNGTVPEPSSLLLAVLALGGLAWVRRGRRWA